MHFDLIHSDPDSNARAGLLMTDHGPIETPIFMPVGTNGSVKGVHQRELQQDVKAEIILGNTYHLFLRPGTDIIEKAGGLHKFISWDKPILTDSGGYQVYSLSGSRKINEESINRISLQIINLFKKNFKKQSTVLILGVAFKGTPETIDIRNSPSIILSKKLSNNKINNFLYDVKGRDIAKNNKQIKNFLFDSKKIKNFDLIIIANNNPKYGNLIVDNLSKIKSKNKSKLIYDCWNTLDKEVCKSSGYKYYTI